VNADDKPKFSQLLFGIAELYGKGLSNNLFEIYWYALEKYSLDDIRRALGQHAVNPDVGQFMPKPADVVRVLEGRSAEKALIAWTKVLNAMKFIGSYHSIRFDDPLIHAVIDEMGGWIVLCHADENKLPFLCKEFERRYSAYLQYPPVGTPKQLTGIIEHQNRLYDHHVPEAIYFDGKRDFNQVISKPQGVSKALSKATTQPQPSKENPHDKPETE